MTNSQHVVIRHEMPEFEKLCRFERLSQTFLFLVWAWPLIAAAVIGALCLIAVPVLFIYRAVVVPFVLAPLGIPHL